MLTYNGYLTAKRKLKAKYDSDLEVIERMWEIAQNTGCVESQKRVINKSSLVREAIQSMQKQFTYHDISKYLKLHHSEVEFSDSYICNTLIKEANSNNIEIIIKGKGRRAQVYKKTYPHPDLGIPGQ